MGVCVCIHCFTSAVMAHVHIACFLYSSTNPFVILCIQILCGIMIVPVCCLLFSNVCAARIIVGFVCVFLSVFFISAFSCHP